MRGAGIHRRPSRFPCALRPETGGATGRKNLFFPLPLFSELVKVLKIFDFNGAGHPSWVSRTHPFFPSRKSPLAALRLFPLLGFPAHTLHPQGVCSIRKAAEPLTAALPYRYGESTSLSTASPLIVSKKSFWPAVVHKKRPAAKVLLAVIYILSPSFWRGAGSFGKGPSPLLFALCYALPAR